MADPHEVPDYDKDRAAKIKGGHLTDAQDRSMQRNHMMSLQESAQAGRIKGLISLDKDPRRSFSADPLNDPFGVDRKNWSLGKLSDKPRVVSYYIKVEPVAGKLVHPLFEENSKGGWVHVIEEIEESVLEEGRDTPIEKGRSRPRSRRPDLFRAEMVVRDKTVKFLEKQEFKVLPIEPENIFKKVPDAYKALPVLPEKLRAVGERILVKSTDWNRFITRAELLGHFDKHRKTMSAAALSLFEKFGIKAAKGTRILFVMRDIYYESWQSLHKHARQVFKPAAWFTMLAEGKIDPIEGVDWVEKPDLVPKHIAKHAKAAAKLGDDLKEVVKLFEKLFPPFIKKKP